MAFRSVTGECVAQALTMPQVEAEFRLPLAVGPVLAEIGQAGEVPADRDHHAVAAPRAAERHDVLAIGPDDLDGLVGTIVKYRRPLVPQLQQPADQRKLDPSIDP